MGHIPAIEGGRARQQDEGVLCLFVRNIQGWRTDHLLFLIILREGKDDIDERKT